MQLVDTHCHLYLEDFDADIDEVIAQAVGESVTHFYLPNIDSSSIQRLYALEKRFPDKCFAMMGLHPCSVKENVLKELLLVEKHFSERKFCAVGEIGLDFYWDKTFVEQQYTAFRQQILWAIEYHLPIVIHSRNSMDECIAVVREFASKGLRGIFHCFSGSYDQARQIIETGFLLGIGGVVTYKKTGLDQVLDKIDLKHIVLETDAPYLTPVPFRGKRNESKYLKYIVERIAAIQSRSVEEVATATTANALQLFGG
jgi:TatD DNase family protein